MSEQFVCPLEHYEMRTHRVRQFQKEPFIKCLDAAWKLVEEAWEIENRDPNELRLQERLQLLCEDEVKDQISNVLTALTEQQKYRRLKDADKLFRYFESAVLLTSYDRQTPDKDSGSSETNRRNSPSWCGDPAGALPRRRQERSTTHLCWFR